MGSCDEHTTDWRQSRAEVLSREVKYALILSLEPTKWRFKGFTDENPAIFDKIQTFPRPNRVKGPDSGPLPEIRTRVTALHSLEALAEKLLFPISVLYFFGGLTVQAPSISVAILLSIFQGFCFAKIFFVILNVLQMMISSISI